MSVKDVRLFAIGAFMEKYQHVAFPWRMIALVLSVVMVILVTFGLWGGAIDAWVHKAVAWSGENRLLIAAILFAVLASDILLPVPSSLASTTCGVLLGPVLGFVVSFCAMTASAAIGYEMCGRFSPRARRAIGENDWRCLERLHEKGGRWLLLVLRPVPVLAEASTLFAGIGKHPRVSAYMQFLIGNAVVSAVYVVAGSYFEAVEGSASAAFLACMSVAALCVLVSARFRRG